MAKKLETYKAFSYVAWTTVVLFSLFTYNLVLDLQDTVSNMEKVATQQFYAPVTKSE